MGKKVFVVDDYPDIRLILKRLLQGAGHLVKLEAGAVNEALGLIEEAKKEGIEVAVLDNSLGGGGDGSTIAAALRKEIPGIKIISFSTLDDLKWPEIAVVKPDFRKVIEAVTNI